MPYKYQRHDVPKGKINFRGKTKSGKGTVTLSTINSVKGKVSMKLTSTAYRTKKGQRRILQVTTLRRVIK